MGNGSQDNEMNANFRYDLIVCHKSYLQYEGCARKCTRLYPCCQFWPHVCRLHPSFGPDAVVIRVISQLFITLILVALFITRSSAALSRVLVAVHFKDCLQTFKYVLHLISLRGNEQLTIH